MNELSREYWEDYKWENENRSELAKRYPNRWVAIVNKEVIGVGEDIKSAELESNRRTKRAEYPILFIERGIHVYKG